MSEPTTGTDTGQTAGRRPGHSPLVASLEAGRLFHRARALACELTLSGRPLTERRLIEEVTPALVAAVGVTAPSSAGWAERELGRWLRELAGRLGGIDHVERLDDQQQALDGPARRPRRAAPCRRIRLSAVTVRLPPCLSGGRTNSCQRSQAKWPW